MSLLRGLKKRIYAVKGTQKLTQAMKMMSIIKLNRLQEEVRNFRNYTSEMHSLIFRVASRVGEGSHPLLRRTEKLHNLELIVFTSERGLCGGFNGNLLRRLEAHLEANPYHCEKVDTTIIGRKGYEFFKARNIPYKDVELDLYQDFNMTRARGLAKALATKFLNSEYDGAMLAYNKFVSTTTLETSFDYVLPIQVSKVEGNRSKYVCDVSLYNLLDKLLFEFVAIQIYQAYLNTTASELAARFVAMDGAQNNAAQMLDVLTLDYNRTRQTVITKELIDIVGGASAI